MAITDETTRTETTPGRDYPPPATTTTGRGWTIGAFVCAAVAVLLLPYVFGPVGMILGYVGHRKGDPLGRWAMGASFIGLCVGLLLIGLFLNAADGGASGS